MTPLDIPEVFTYQAMKDEEIKIRQEERSLRMVGLVFAGAIMFTAAAVLCFAIADAIREATGDFSPTFALLKGFGFFALFTVFSIGRGMFNAVLRIDFKRPDVASLEKIREKVRIAPSGDPGASEGKRRPGRKNT